MPLNPSEKKFFEQLAEAAKAVPQKPLEDISLAELREGVSIFKEYAGQETDVQKKNRTVPARDAYAIPVTIYNPRLKHSPVLIFYPGCGHLFPLFEVNCVAASRIAKHTNIKVIVIDHRLAPEHAMPGPIMDAYDVTHYIYSHTKEFDINPDYFFIVGFSSGAACAATMSHLAQLEKNIKIHRQILLNGLYDLTGSLTDCRDFEEQDRLLTREGVLNIFRLISLSDEQKKDPLNSPFFQNDMRSLPPTSMLIAEHDTLRSQSEAYYQKLIAAGNHVERILLPGQSHNTMIIRAMSPDGQDPAETIAKIIMRDLSAATGF